MIFKKCLLLWLIALTSTVSSAAQFVDHAGFRIHYTTFSSMIIPADVAGLHQITRAENRIVLNISAIKDEQPAEIGVTGSVTNLLNQEYELVFSEVNEAEAIYYLASHLALEHDILRFNINIQLSDGDSIPIRFIRRYD